MRKFLTGRDSRDFAIRPAAAGPPLAALATVIALLAVSPVFAETYYVSPSGNDSNPGTSPTAPWATVRNVNSRSFKAGDVVRMEGGRTFLGPIELGSGDSGAAGSPVLVTSYGNGRATVDGGRLHAITVKDASFLTIANLNVVGLGIKTGQEPGGTGIRVQGGSFITVEQVEASGFRWAGVEIDNSSDARVIRVYAHDNGYAGIRGKANTPRLYVGHCRAIHNPGDPNYLKDISGSGIELYHASYATIEYCEAGFNGGDQSPRGNGPVGIWIAFSHHVTIQNCISHDNTNPTGDGGGIDLDAGCYENVVQYNYCYNNKGYGVQLWQWGGKVWLEKNVIRYNVLVNSRDDKAHTIWIGHNANAATGIRDNVFYNNLIVNEGPAIGISGTNVSNLRFFNNILVTTEATGFLTGATESQGFKFAGNCYWSLDGKFDIYGKYSSLESWANTTGQEMVDGRLVGLFADPKYEPLKYEPLKDGPITDPAGLSRMNAFRLREHSPCIDRGLDLRKLYQMDPGTHDLFGNPIPAGAAFDIGPHEPRLQTSRVTD
ncbi:MAG: right-handed parallel beta-helix repeat-containing protein [Acidobacteria bacterium]|nr:MAG: right-handed parallel beta-helix repeat-containing protein [Acidobacteriota bacterium]